MEHWYDHLESFPEVPDVKIYLQAIQTVAAIAKEDLAEFEVEYLSSTVFYEPVNLFDCIKRHRNTDSWAQVLEKSFKIISEIVQKFGDFIQRYIQDIVESCQQSFAPTTRRHALNCLAIVVRHSQAPFTTIARLIAELQSSDTCRAPLALLVGAICEHHPEDVSDSIEVIWRSFLKLLEGRANSETIPASILQGVYGIFKHFGLNLPTAEVNEFYTTLVQLFYTNSKCENVCLNIFTHYADLFPERLHEDQKTRAVLWKKLPNSAPAIQSVYQSFKSFKDYQLIIQKEITPRLKSKYYSERFTALRVIDDINITKMYTDIHSILYEIRSDNTSPEILDSIQLCVESNLPDCERLLKVCIDKYEVIPKTKKCQVFVHTLLKASEEVRDNVIKYLIFDTCQPHLTDEVQAKYYSIWSDIFDVKNGKDTIVLERSKIVYNEFMIYILEVLNNNDFYENNIPENILPIIDLLAHIIICYDKENAWYAHALKTRCSHDAVKTLANACVNGALVDLNQILDIRRCADEASLCECCLAVITAPCEASLSDETVLEALQVLFSTNKISEQSLLLSLKKMEQLLTIKPQELKKNIVKHIIHKISKIENRKDFTSKEGRILKQDVALFLAKFHNATQLYNPLNNNDNYLLSTAEDLTLSVLNSIDGCVYKIDLKSLLHTALVEEDPKVLQSIMALVCTRTSENDIRLTASISVVQCSCHVRGDIVQAPLSRVHRDAINYIIQYLSETKSPGLRRMLSDGVRDLVSCAGVESEHSLQVIAEHVKIMLMNEKVETIRAGLDLSRTLLSLLNAKSNHTTMQEILPQLIILTADTCQNESPAILEEATNTLIDKLALFDATTIDNTIKRAMMKLLDKDLTVDSRNVKLFKKMSSAFVFVIKNVYDGFEMEGSNIFDCVKGGRFENRIFVLAIVKEVLQMSADQIKTVTDDKELLEKLFTYELRDKDYFAFESILMFFNQYCGILLELRYQNTILRLREIIQLITPEIITKINKTFKQCLSTLKSELSKIPQNILASIEQLLHNLNLEQITRLLKDGDVSVDIELSVAAVKVVIGSLDEESLAGFVTMKHVIRDWPDIVIRLFASGRLHEDLKFKMALLTDVLKLSLSIMTVEGIKQLILESGFSGLPNERIGLDFCRHFISSFYRFLLKTPFILLDDDMKECSSLLNEVVKEHMKLNFPEDDSILILELVDKLWPIYATNSTFKQKYDLLLLLNSFPKLLNPKSNPVRWMEDTICDGGEFGDFLLSVLPEGKSYSDCYAYITKDMPLRLSEMNTKWRTTFAAMLECLSNTGDLVLLDIVAKFAAGDSTAGWWDDQLASCALSLSKRQDDTLIDSLYALCVDIPSLCVVEKLLLPVLRYSPTSSSDAFFTRHLPQLLASISRTVPTNTGERYRLNLIENIRAVIIVTVAFEKPSNTIDWQTGREVCKRCVTLRDRLHKMADHSTKEEQRRLHAACYTSVSFALVRWRRFDASVGKFVCSETAFRGLVGDVEAPIVTFRSSRTIRQSCVSDDVTTLHTATLTHTHARTPVLLTYFTDNPANYDLTEEKPKQTEDVQEITLPDNPLNKHESAAAMMAVILQLSKLPSTDWLDAIVGALTSDMRCQDKWLICQIICNLKELLSPHASKLSPALLGVVAEADGQILNAVHIYVLETLSDWGCKDDINILNIKSALSNLINTCLVNSENNYLFFTLDNVLEKFLKSFENYLTVDEEIADRIATNKNKNYTKIITRLLNNNIMIQNLMPSLLQSITSNRLSNIDAKHFGLLKPNEGELIKFRSMLESIRRVGVEDYVKKIYYAQMQYDKVCNEHHFRMIFELVPKIVGDIKKKCLNIISSYISKNTNKYIKDMFETIEICELMLTDYVIDALQVVRNGHRQMSHAVRSRALSVIADLCQNVSVKVREAAFDAVNVMLRDSIPQDTQAHTSKRPKLSLSKVLQLSETEEVWRIVNCVCVGTTDKDSGIASVCRITLSLILSDNLNIRFAECLHLVIYLPSKQRIQRHTDICACVNAILEMLFHGVRQTDVWARQKIELPRCQRQESDSLLLTMSRTYQGTFTKTLGINKHMKNLKAETLEETIVCMEDVLSSFLEFAKNNTRAALNLLSSIAFSFKPTSPEFDALWEPMLVAGLAQVNEISYLLLYVCRAGYISDSLQPQVSKLRELSTSTEGYGLINLLYEELNIKYQNHSQFILGSYNTCMDLDDVKAEKYDEEFSITKLTSAFKMLSNWDNLTIQEQNNIKTSDLPILWIDKDAFSDNIQKYTDSNDWFGILSTACFDQKQINVMNIMSDISKWPRRPFIVSALSEAVHWQITRQFEMEHSQYKQFEIPREECLIEWAARLMLRSIYLQRQGSDEIALSRSHELRWCERASEMEIPGIVNQCIERNSNEDWDRSEVLPWLRQKVLSEMCIGNGRLEVARKCLDKLDSTVPQYVDDTTADVLLDLNRMKMKLISSCGELTQNKVQDILDNSNSLLNVNDNNKLYSNKFKKSLKMFYEKALVWFGGNETRASKEIVENISNIGTILNKMDNYNIINTSHIDYLVMSLDQLADGLSEDLVKMILNVLQTVLPHFDNFSLQQIRRHLPLFSSSLGSYPALREKLQEKGSMSRPSLCLQLVCDAKFSLRQFCDRLMKNLDDDDVSKWRETFVRMKRRIFDNKDAGVDYQLLLNKSMRQQLFAVQDIFETDKAKIRSTLQSVVTSLGRLLPQSTLRLSQLCPYLRTDRITDDVELTELIGCGKIVKFDEQVQVYTDSIRQPCVIKLLLTNGTTKYYIHKSGEELRGDAAAQRVANVIRMEGYHVKTYGVTVLDDDSALIERLDNHQRLGTFIPGTNNLLANMNFDPRPANNLLILSPTSALIQHHVRLTGKVPADALRSAMEGNSSCVEDFLMKKDNFQVSLVAMTIITFIMGLGDRHLNNILYGSTDGSIVSVDWGAVLWTADYELTVARLTRCLVAVVDKKALENGLQKMLLYLRETPRRDLFFATIKTSFCWLDSELKNKLKYIDGILKGHYLPYHITNDVITQSKMANKQKYVDLIQKVFENYPQKDFYTVEDQITCLLRQCTSYEILGAIRREWEPWV